MWAGLSHLVFVLMVFHYGLTEDESTLMLGCNRTENGYPNLYWSWKEKPVTHICGEHERSLFRLLIPRDCRERDSDYQIRAYATCRNEGFSKACKGAETLVGSFSGRLMRAHLLRRSYLSSLLQRNPTVIGSIHLISALYQRYDQINVRYSNFTCNF